MLKPMLIRERLALFLIFSCVSFSQQPQAPPVGPYAQSFPVVMQQSVSAGKTRVGTKIEAKLEVATLADGKVLPKNTILTGEVIESTAKTKTTPSRLSIRMDSAQWKDGTAPLRLYLTAQYYPGTEQAGQSLQYGPATPANKTWNGQGAYPNPNSPSYKPFPGGESDADKNSVPDTASTKLSDHPISMKNVELARALDGTAALVCNRANIKLDRLTTYIFAASDSTPTN